jgi:hypothetical protein
MIASVDAAESCGRNWTERNSRRQNDTLLEYFTASFRLPVSSRGAHRSAGVRHAQDHVGVCRVGASTLCRTC